jgi:hypothetical protein
MVYRPLAVAAVVVFASMMLACAGGPEPEPGMEAGPMVEEQPQNAEPEAPMEEETAAYEDEMAEPAETAEETQPAEPAVPMPRPGPDFVGTLAQVSAAVEEASRNKAPIVLIDAPFVVGGRWETEPWANDATVDLAPNGAAVCLTPEEGPRGKWVATLDQTLDLTGYQELRLEVKADADIAVAAGIWTGPVDEPHLYESVPSAVKSGDWRDVVIPLQGGNFKSAGSDWKFGADLADPDKVRRISIFVYAEEPTSLCWRMVHAVTGE